MLTVYSLQFTHFVEVKYFILDISLNIFNIAHLYSLGSQVLNWAWREIAA